MPALAGQEGFWEYRHGAWTRQPGPSAGWAYEPDPNPTAIDGIRALDDGAAFRGYGRASAEAAVAAPSARANEKTATELGKHGARDQRPDIQGLRALAVAMVVVYHLDPPTLPGGFAGVDVFFVISGFLITGQLWRAYQRAGRVSLVEFWGRRARRLMPASALVLAVTWLGSRVVLPATQLPDTAEQIRASALYFQNWLLAHDAVDYLKSNDAVTPVEHFWSLSVEEQFYLVWPLLFVIAAVATRSAWRRRRAAGGGTAPGAASGDAPVPGYRVIVVLTTALVVASLAFSVHESLSNPQAAYFITTTRMWELGIGGLLALLPARPMGVLARQGWLGWAGLVMVVGSCFVLSGSLPFPGWIALLPVLGSAALIAGGSAQARFSPAPLTSLPPMVFVGGISYSLYLWHYPVIVLWTSYRGHGPGLLDGLGIVAISVLLAWLTKLLVEDKVRLWSLLAKHKWRSLSTALAAVAPVALAMVFLAGQGPPPTGPLGPDYPGAAALASSSVRVPAEPARPSLLAAEQDFPSYETHGCLGDPNATVPTECVYGDTAHPRLTMALVGDSYAGNWFPSLNAMAVKYHWKLVTVLHGGCPWTATMMMVPVGSTQEPYSQCHAWGVTVLSDLLTKIHPNVVITSEFPDLGAVAHPAHDAQARGDIGKGMAQYWEQLEGHGISVVAIQESPRMAQNTPLCLATAAKRNQPVSTCDTPLAQAEPSVESTVVASKLTGGKVPVVDMNSLICAPTVCEPIIGNVVVFIDSHHLTDTYARTLTPYFEQRLLAVSPVLAAAVR